MKKGRFPKFESLKAKSRRLELRPLKLSDYKAWHTGWSGRAKHKTKWDVGQLPKSKLTLRGFKTRLSRDNRRAKAGEHFAFGLFHRKTGDWLGTVDILIINHELKWANLGYGINNQHWGHGYAPEGAKLALEIAFKKLKLHRVEASTETGNRPSRKTALRAGLRYEGTRKKFYFWRGGKDSVVFGINRIDYAKRKRK